MIKELRDKAVRALKEARSLLDKADAEKRIMTADEDKQYGLLVEEHTKTMSEVEKRTRLAEHEKHLAGNESEARAKPAPGDAGDKHPESNTDKRGGLVSEETRALALQAWFRAPLVEKGEAEITDEQRAAAKSCGFNIGQKEIGFSLRSNYRPMQRDFRTAQSSITGSLGGFLVPEGFVSNLETALLEYGGMRQVADVMRTATGNDLPWPTSNDTTNEGEIVGENTQGNEQNMTFGQVIFKAYKYSSKMIKIPTELLQDSAIDLASMAGKLAGERLGRIQNRHFTLGTAAGQPKGITLASTLGVTSAAATAIKADELIELIHSVDPAYRIGAGFMMHDGIMLYISKLKDGNGQYLLQSLAESTALRIKGYPVTINQSMQSTVATATKTVFFGQLSKYKIRDAGEIRLKRLDERYAELDQVAFLAFMRSDGNLLDSGVAPVKHILQA